MQRFLLTVDKISTWAGQLFAWSIVVLTAMICFEVASRYVFNHPHAWVFDGQIMLYGILFMMAGAYTLAKSGHVRGDVLYGFFSPRTQAFFDLILYVVFFVPGVAALAWAGFTFAQESVALGERSSITADGPPIWPFKLFIPAAGALLLLQGCVEIVRCVLCLRDGHWPSREEDVEEVDVEKLKALVSHDDAAMAQVGPVSAAGER